MFKIFKVKGHSMVPRYQDGDFLILRSITPGATRLRAGDTIIFEHDLFGVMVKHIWQVDPPGKRLFVVSEHDDGLDSRQLGWIDAGCVLGRVVFHIGRPR